METEKVNRLPYYEKPIVKLGDVNPGSYIYDDWANLCYVDDHYNLHSYGIESWRQPTSEVYLVTLETKRIADRMHQERDKWYRSGLMNPMFSNQLADDLRALMEIDPYSESAGEEEKAIWFSIDNRYNEMAEHAKALSIFKNPDDKC